VNRAPVAGHLGVACRRYVGFAPHRRWPGRLEGCLLEGAPREGRGPSMVTGGSKGEEKNSQRHEHFRGERFCVPGWCRSWVPYPGRTPPLQLASLVSAIGDLVHRDTHVAESHRSRRRGSSTGCLVPLPAVVSGRPAFRAPWPPCRRKSERPAVEAAKPRDFAIVRLSQRSNWQGDTARPDLRPMLPSSGGGATPPWQAGVQP
jgi:hypothetical protein